MPLKTAQAIALKLKPLLANPIIIAMRTPRVIHALMKQIVAVIDAAGIEISIQDIRHITMPTIIPIPITMTIQSLLNITIFMKNINA